MPIFKFTDSNGTHYNPHPERVIEISDVKYTDPRTLKKVEGCQVLFYGEGFHHSLPLSARALKRSIQENTDVEIGFLKFSHQVQKGNRYINVAHVADFVIDTTGKGHLYLEHIDKNYDNPWRITITAPTDPLQVALQLRRVVNRLEQDDELCCNAPPAPAEEEEGEDA